MSYIPNLICEQVNSVRMAVQTASVNPTDVVNLSSMGTAVDSMHATVTGETSAAVDSLHATMTSEMTAANSALHATVTGETAAALDALHATVTGETGVAVNAMHTTVTGETAVSIAAATDSLHATVTSETAAALDALHATMTGEMTAADSALHTAVTGETTSAINSLHTTVTSETGASIAAALAALPSPNATAPLVYGSWNSGVTSTTVSSGSVLCSMVNMSATAVGIGSASNLGTITASGTHTCKIGYKVRLESLLAYEATSKLYISGAAVNSDGTDDVKQGALAVTGSRTLQGSAFIAGLTSASTVTVQVTRVSGTFTVVWTEISIESIYST